MMLDNTSEVDLESDTSSVDGIKENIATNEQLCHRVESLQQENRVLKTEIETLKLKIRGLNEVNQQLRQNSVNIQARAEQEEEYISNTLLKKITELKKEKESLAINYEQEEECLTNELNRKFTQLRQEKVALERTLAREQEDQECLDRLRREKIELENALEQEQEALVNRLWKKMEKLENEKRTLQDKLESLGALLSGSSSNQSLGSGTQQSTSGNTNVVPTCVAVSMAPSAPNVPTTRPTSSGHGSLRASLHNHGAPSSAPSAAVSSSSPLLCTVPAPLGSTTDAVRSSIPNSGVSTALDVSSGDVRQSSANANTNEVNRIHTGDVATAQSPMDVDNYDHSGSTSPCRTKIPNFVQKIPGDSTKITVGPPKPEQPTNWSSFITEAYVNQLREEVGHLKKLLEQQEAENASKMPVYESEERSAVEENRRLRKLLQMERERREALSRQLSESESSLEMEDERQFNEACRNPRIRTTSESASPFYTPGAAAWTVGANPSSIYGPGHAYAVAVAAGLSGRFCRECGQRVPAHLDDWALPVCGTSSVGRGLPNSLHTTVSHTAAGRMCHGHCCSPSASPGKSCGQHNFPPPNSPATPTTSSGSVGGGGQGFAKPRRRVPLVVAPADRTAVVPDTNTRDSYLENRLSSYSSSEQLFVDIGPDSQTGDQEDDDEDARCVTPP
ncbi:hypothetical protein X801_09765, partial [Opisthorchis viverrini]